MKVPKYVMDLFNSKFKQTKKISQLTQDKNKSLYGHNQQFKKNFFTLCTFGAAPMEKNSQTI